MQPSTGPDPVSTAAATAHAGAGVGQRAVLVRHGETEWSRTGRHTGRADIPLTPRGEAQARQTGLHLRGWRFAEVRVSPLGRARRTCELAGVAQGAVADPRLQEWDYGAYEGLTAEEIRARRPGWTIWRDGVVGGESAADVAHRARAVIAEVRQVQGDVALFAHGHLLRILAACWCDLPVGAAAHLELGAGAISVLGWERETPTISRWNDTSHLLSPPG